MTRTTAVRTSFRPQLECLEDRAAPSTTALAVTPNPGPAAQQVTLTAYITNTGRDGVPPGAGTVVAGTVTFYDGATPLGTARVGNGSVLQGTAVFTTSSLKVGSHALSAQYSGDVWVGVSTAPSSSGVVNTVINPPLARVAYDALVTAIGMTANNGGYIFYGVSDYLKMLSYASGPANQELALTYFTNLVMDMDLMSG